MRFNTDRRGLVARPVETASRKARTKHVATPLAGMVEFTDVYQTAAMQRLAVWLERGATHGPQAFFAAVRQAGYMPYPADSLAEHISLAADTGAIRIAADTATLATRQALRASTAIFTTVLERGYSQPSCDFLAVNVLRPMIAGDIRYVAASQGQETAQDRVAGISAMSPRIATFTTWLLASLVYVCEQLHSGKADTISMPQATAYEAIEAAEAAHKARLRKASAEYHNQAGKWYNLVLKDSAIRKQERREAAQARGKRLGYRHH